MAGREGPGRPGEARKTRKTREGPEAPEDPGRPGSLGGPGKAPEGPRAAKDPARKPERPCRAVCPEGGRPAEGRRRDCRCTACGGQASPLFPTPPQAGCGQGGCGLAPVQGRLSASLKQVPGCLKGRCPATWVHERAEIAPNRAQRQRPAASGRSRGDCPRCRVKIQPQGAFFWSVNVTFCVFSTRTDCRRPFSGAGAGRASGGVVPTVPAAA